MLGGIVGLDVVLAGAGVDPVNEVSGAVTTRPGGAGSFVVALADPGSTAGFESLMLDFLMSTKALCNSKRRLALFQAVNYVLVDLSYPCIRCSIC